MTICVTHIAGDKEKVSSRVFLNSQVQKRFVAI